DGYSAVDRTRRVQQDLPVLIGGMGERTVTVHVAEGPDALDRGLKPAIDGEEAALIGLDPMVGAKKIGVRSTTGGHQQMTAGDGRAVPKLYLDATPARSDSSRTPVNDVDALLSQHVRKHRGHVLVLPRGETAARNDRHARPEPAKYLAKLQPDVSTADDHQVIGEGFQGQQLDLGHGLDSLQARKRGIGRAGAEIEVQLLRRQLLVVNAHSMLLAGGVGWSRW